MTRWPHGDVSDAELRERGLDVRDVVDFAVNVDPKGPPDAVREAFRAAAIHRYPDPRYRDLVRALAHRDRLEAEHILVGAGVTSLLWILMRALASRHARPLRVMVCEPDFAEYAAASRAAGAQMLAGPKRHMEDLSIDVDALERAVETQAPDALILGTPHNPGGRCVELEALMGLCERHPRCEVIVDEAFMRLSVAAASIVLPVPANVWRLRSLTKELGIPGLRVGYLCAEPQRRAMVARFQPPWPVGHPAAQAALVGVSDPTFVDDARKRMRADTLALIDALIADGWSPLGTDTVFFLLPVDDAPTWTRELFAHRILVRDCSSFGLRGHIRLCGRPFADRERLLAALEDIRRSPPRHLPAG